MKYTTKPRKKFTYTLKAKKWFKLEYKEKSFKDLRNYINEQPSSSSIWNAIGMRYTENYKPTI
tara:strand:- start:616 stop:804 length:189 start_codon:yes stop_codon:yes gene_type:complete